MRIKVYLFMLVLVGAVVASLPAFAIDLRAILRGTITSGDSGVTVLVGDKVQMVLAEDTFQILGQASITDAEGNYVISIVLDERYDNVDMRLIYRQGNTWYKLTNTNGTRQLIFPYLGTPQETVVPIDGAIGDVLRTTTATGSPGNFQPTNSAFDADGNGIFNKKDLRNLKRAIKSGKSGDYDINNDGRTSTRDMVEAIKSYQKQLFQQRIQ